MGFPSTIVIFSLLSLAFLQACSGQLKRDVSLAGIVPCINASISTARTYRVIPEARVDVVCGIMFLEKVIKSTETNFVGIYSFSFNTTERVMLRVPELCHLKVTLPPNSCVFEPSGGFLKFPIIGIRSGLGSVNQFIPGAPSYRHL